MFKLIFRQKRRLPRLWTMALVVCAGIACAAGCRKEYQDHAVLLETVALPETNEQPQMQSMSSESTQNRVNEEGSESISGSFTEETVCDDIYVYVCGCVNAPGVYKLSSQSRVFEAVEAAGGMSSLAAAESINLAMKLTDQMQIYVPSEEEVLEGSSYPGKDMAVPAESSLSGGESTGKLNINTATAAQLDALPGIGASKAEDIVNYREENGGFSKTEELMNIPGIKQGIFDKIKDLVTVD